ncbi:MAG: hypothetical protein ACI8UO_002610 [Verrucomicrobiales bacterium]|jgi:hypothetical protein
MSPEHEFNFCGSPEHNISRRAWLSHSLAVGSGALLGTTGAIHALDEPSVNDALRTSGRSVILLWLAGGASQMETWDPKPGVPTGGPFASIPTSMPGVRISELMPKMAERMHRISVVRSIDSGDAGHGTAARTMLRGRKNEAALTYPCMGSVLSRELERAQSRVPGYVSFYSQTEGRGNTEVTPSFLGAQYAAMELNDGMTPNDISRLDEITEFDHLDRAELRQLLSDRFARGRDLGVVRSHANAYARVHGLMSSEELFNLENEPEFIRNRYGPSLFGQQVLMARRLAEAGVPFIRVGRAWWDSHGQNFETHAEMVPELDHVMATLLDDLDQRGMLESTLVLAVGEFGRTPKINASLGRDHFARAWSTAMFGCGIKEGKVYGETDELGEYVASDPVGAGEIFATVLKATGINPEKEYLVGSRPVPLVNPGIEPISDILS